MKICISNIIYSYAVKLAQTADPNDLYKQLAPLLSIKLHLNTFVERSKTMLVPNMTTSIDNQTHSLYKVTLRKSNTILNETHIQYLKRNAQYFYQLRWSQDGMVLLLWWPYVNPEETTTEAIPGQPRQVSKIPGI